MSPSRQSILWSFKFIWTSFIEKEIVEDDKIQQVGVLAIIRDLKVVGKIWTQEEIHTEVVCGKF